MWTTLMSKLLGSFSEKAADVYIKRQELKAEIKLEEMRGKVAYQQAKTQRAADSEGHDHDWEMESIKNSGWKDEWVLIVLSIPMILVFIPWTQPYIESGFVALAATPLWYRTTVMAIYLATFGIRLWRRDVSKPGLDAVKTFIQ